MPKRTGDFDQWLLGELSDPQVAASYINAAICDDPELLPEVLREVAKTHTMKKVAEKARVARESLYTILSEHGNPTLDSLTGILNAVGLRIKVAPLEKPSANQPCKACEGETVSGRPLLNEDVLGQAANTGVVPFASENFTATGQSSAGFAFNQGVEFIRQPKIVLIGLAEEKGEAYRWNPINLLKQYSPNVIGSPMISSMKAMPTTSIWNQPLGI